MNASISHVLLDIEGTTCPVHFVSGTLFPYATAQLEAFLQSRQDDEAVQDLLAQAAETWRQDPDPAARDLWLATPTKVSLAKRLLPYLRWLIDQDRKLTALKDLQGLIWEEGYAQGALQGPLYPDVAPALARWREAGLRLAVYSSGSVKAQQLIYGHSNAGDLRPLFQHWFDTRIGSKLEPDSYSRIIASLGATPQGVLFISDAIAELKAARAKGLSVLLCERDETASAPLEGEGLATIRSFDQLNPREMNNASTPG